FRKEIFKTEYLILLASVFLMAFSVLVDIVHDDPRLNVLVLNATGAHPDLLGEVAVLFEETSKGLGVLTWLIYFSRVLFINVLPAKNNDNLGTSRRRMTSAPFSQEIK
ncbi:MAG TPA: hypothetical protein VNA26_04915, partial [Chitinophagaceae bacterium]|nr:hypothetical protein [Chitinophagaceae bacterium]